MTPPNAARAKELDQLTVREAQEALADELGPENASDDGEDATTRNEGVVETEDPTEERGAEIVSLDSTDDVDDDAEGHEETAEEVGDTDDDEAAEDPVWAAAQMAEHLRMVEALLFASNEPIDKAGLVRRLPAGADVPALLETLEQHYENRGVVLSKAGGRYRFITNPSVAHVLEEQKTEQRKVSRAALETLAIIAYHQPCTRADIEDVRGVAVSKGSLDQLLEMGWVRLRGRRKDAPGRPVLYGTTPAFLEHFNLETVGDLPGMADLKAAGLLDARLPPSFAVPTPSEVSGDDGEGDDDVSEESAEFVQDFCESDQESGEDVAPEDDEGLLDAVDEDPGDQA